MPVDMAVEMRLSFLRFLEDVSEARYAARAMYRRYYDGQHDTMLTERMRRFLQLTTGQDFRLNACPIVVEALAERLTVAGFQSDDETLSEAAWDWWRKNRADVLQGIVHLSAVRDGDAYVMVEWDEEKKRPVYSYQPAFDGDEGMEVHYQDGRPLVAVKRWRIEEGADAGDDFRANMYFPDRIERYRARGRGQWTLIEEAEVWAPGVIPVVHFKNRDQGYNYGESELEDPIPLQNGLNKSLIDVLAAADVAGFGMPYLIGDNPAGLTIAPGQFLFTTRPPGGENGASFGKLEADDVTKLIAVKDSLLLDIARITRTPLSAFQVSGAVAAEGTLKQQESGLLAKVANRQVGFGNCWEDVVRLGILEANAFGGGRYDPEAYISTTWNDPETRNEKDHMESLGIKREKLEVPLETLWAEAGYDADQIAQMQEQLEQERAAGTRSLGAALLNQERQFDQGNLGGDAFGIG